MKYLLIIAVVVGCTKSEKSSLSIPKSESIKSETKIQTPTSKKGEESQSPKKSYAVFAHHLKEGEWTDDFAKRCKVLKNGDSIRVKCAPTPCKKLEEKYLLSRYKSERSQKVLRKQMRFDDCRYKHNLDIIHDERSIEERKYQNS